MKTKTSFNRNKTVFVLVIILLSIAAGIIFLANGSNKNDKDTAAARIVADQYLTYVKACDLNKAKQLRDGGISDKDEVSMLCAKGCNPLNFTYVKLYEKLKTEVVPGDPEQKPIKSVSFQYEMTCGKEKKPYMMGMQLNSEVQKWQVFLDTSIGNPAAL